MTDGREIAIPPARADAVVDPTGCGDAYRAGLIFGLMQGLDWETTGRIASLIGAHQDRACRNAESSLYGWTSSRHRFRAAFGRAI